MRLLNKIVVGASSVAFAAALAAGVSAPVPAAAEETSQTPSTSAATVLDKVSINLEDQALLIVGDTADKQISVSFPKVKGTEVTGEKNICTYDVDSKGDVTVDLSTLSSTKDNYVKVWGNKNKDAIIIKIPKAVTLDKSKVKFDKDGKATATVCEKGQSAAYAKGVVEFAVGTGSWFYVGDDDDDDVNPSAVFPADDFTALGATIRARVAGAYKSNSSITNRYAIKDTAAANIKDYTLKKSSDVKYKAYEIAYSFPSKEIKIKVPKKAAAPKVKVDYTKGTVKLPKNAQYRKNTIGDAGALTLGTSWADASDKVLDASKNDGDKLDITKAGSFDVRIKATETKPASMYLAFSYDAQAKLLAKKTETNPTKEAATANVGVKKGSADAIEKVDLTATYARKAAVYKKNDGKTVKTATSGAITISNANTKYTYDCVLLKGDNTQPTAENTKKGVKSVKNGKNVEIKIKNDDVYTLYARRAAVKGGTDWATEWVKVISFSKEQLVPTAIGADAINS